MPWIGPDSMSLRLLVGFISSLRLAGARAAVLLRLSGLLAAIFLRPGAFFAAFFLATFFLATGFFLAAFFFATFFFLAGFFDAGLLAARFLLARLLAADFLATAFLFATFFLLADFFPAGFLRATAFFLDAFFADIVFFVTLRLFPAVFFLADGLRFAAFFREALAGLRFLLAVFFAGILNSCRPRKTRNYTLLAGTWKHEFRGFFGGDFRSGRAGLQRRFSGTRRALEVPLSAALSTIRHSLASIVLCHDLHYTTPNSRAWA